MKTKFPDKCLFLSAVNGKELPTKLFFTVMLRDVQISRWVGAWKKRTYFSQ